MSCGALNNQILQEIGTVCARALERQTRHTQLQQRSIATVLLDEGGLPGVSPPIHIAHLRSRIPACSCDFAIYNMHDIAPYRKL